jgi:hypothetical protein
MSKFNLSVVVFSFFLALPVFAKDSQDRKKLIEMHEKMAHQHRVAAKCLKAGKSVEECNNEAMKGCPMMDSGHCPFMDNNMMGSKGSDSMKMNQ